MMDLKELIKWLVPCLRSFGIKDVRLTIVCLFLLFNFCSGLEAKVSDSKPNRTFFYNKNISFNSDQRNETVSRIVQSDERSLDDSFSGRTFGRPFKKMIAGLIPVIFQLGMTATWAMVATLIGAKTLLVTLIILKLLLVAGAAKIGALFGAKAAHHKQDWTPHKEIHLHIHNGHHEIAGHGVEEAYGPPSGPWSREGLPPHPSQASESKAVNVLLDQIYGPQTISTPYGNYVRVGAKLPHTPQHVNVRRRRSLWRSS